MDNPYVYHLQLYVLKGVSESVLVDALVLVCHRVG